MKTKSQGISIDEFLYICRAEALIP